MGLSVCGRGRVALIDFHGQFVRLYEGGKKVIIKLKGVFDSVKVMEQHNDHDHS